MRTHVLRFLLVVGILALAASSDAAPIMVRDWTIDTPIGRFGYAEIDYTMMIQVGPGPRMLDRYVYLGPLGRAGLPALVLVSLVVGSGALVWFASRFRRRSHDHAA
jgi:hypothetical protein